MTHTNFIDTDTLRHKHKLTYLHTKVLYTYKHTQEIGVTIHDICLNPQGAASAATWPSQVQQWFQIPASTPHVVLYTAEGHYWTYELDPMVK